MPETLDDLFAAVSADVASRTSPPGAREAIASTRRRSALAVVAVGVVLVAALTTGLLGGASSRDEPDPATSKPPPTRGLGIGRDTVWLDDAGLHRGLDVLQPAVRLGTGGRPTGLARVRAGALYLDAESGDVWLHPWRGEPRVVGHDSRFGAVGDPDGGTAAWFEGDRNAWATDAELVVFDTVRLREVARVRTSGAVEVGGEHLRNGNGILQVSAGSVVWLTQDDRLRRLDTGSGAVTERPSGTGRTRDDASVIDVHDATELRSWGAMTAGDEGLLVRSVPGRGRTLLPGWEPMGLLSPDGGYVLALVPEPHGSRFLDVRTGESFALAPQEGDHYAWIGWSHGSTALIHVTREGEAVVSELYACDAERRRCERLPSRGEVLPPAT